MIIGKVIHSNSHVDYVCQVYRRDEIERPAGPGDFSFGRFVRMELTASRSLIGLIYDTQLYDPEYGRLGPRLSTEAELEVFSPDYLEERTILVSILAVGTLVEDASPSQSVPREALEPGALVETLPAEELRSFHLPGGRLMLAYLPRVLAHSPVMGPHLMLSVLDQLAALLPQEGPSLDLIRDDLLWKSQIQAMGGDR